MKYIRKKAYKYSPEAAEISRKKSRKTTHRPVNIVTHGTGGFEF